ncbi:F0F1 ATP synthase subunit B [Aureibaculum sp. 2210JD6-5]|uniref:F0F1 ATP synthase subunit B n=1 Tax=Aureibaculum sp. 2210JD6-5 TaxID=3103957 RepID=UPI002AAE6F21|nr:F0F1 ATP synthase subunit B [Aureibaculum sp. 2210JD6-5]MDY7394497.1 F0F1 ATP synthase subunit B [Aureibaculum sp. 2210JD6-5]
MDLVTPGFGLVFWTGITFLILLFILRKFAWKPILGAVSEREDSIKNALLEADKARQEMQNLKSDNEKILKEARTERDVMLKEARDIKNNMIAEAKDEAKAQANKIIEQAKTTIQNEKLAAITDLKNQVAELSIDIAEKVVKEQLSNKDKQEKLVESMLKEVKLN